MVNFGIKVAQKDVGIEKRQDLLYSSEQVSPKIQGVLSGSFTTDINGDASLNFGHSLNYSPACIAYVFDNVDWRAIDNTVYYLQVSPSQISLFVNASTASTSFKYKIFILRDPAQVII